MNDSRQVNAFKSDRQGTIAREDAVVKGKSQTRISLKRRRSQRSGNSPAGRPQQGQRSALEPMRSLASNTNRTPSLNARLPAPRRAGAPAPRCPQDPRQTSGGWRPPAAATPGRRLRGVRSRCRARQWKPRPVRHTRTYWTTGSTRQERCCNACSTPISRPTSLSYS